MRLKIFLLLFLLVSCGYSPVSENNEERMMVFFSFKNNPLNQALMSEIKRSGSSLNIEISNSSEADLELEIINHRIGKFLSATDENFFPAVGSLDYQLDFILKNGSKEEFIEFFASENFAYDTDSILSNEQKIEEIKKNFFYRALNEFSFRLNSFSQNF